MKRTARQLKNELKWEKAKRGYINDIEVFVIQIRKSFESDWKNFEVVMTEQRGMNILEQLNREMNNGEREEAYDFRMVKSEIKKIGIQVPDSHKKNFN